MVTIVPLNSETYTYESEVTSFKALFRKFSLQLLTKVF